MYANGHIVTGLMEQLAPKKYAVENDRIGLQLGTLQKPVRKVLVTLDVTHEVVDEAIAAGADLIIAHHAIIFRPLAKLDTSTPAGSLYEKLIKNDIAVYISHTNLDVAEGGINDWLADAIGMERDGRASLEKVYEEQLYKLAVYVPEAQAEEVRQAMWAAGAGTIGAYDQCSFNVAGTGTFRPGAETNPFVGTAGRLETVDEVRVEMAVTESLLRKTVKAMLGAHPYEETAYDVTRLEREGKTLGLGRSGRLEQPVTLGELAERVKAAFDVPFVRLSGDPSSMVRKAAVLGGSGSRYWKPAQFTGAQVLITGDIDFHSAQDALAAGMLLIDTGHYAEKIMKQKVAQWLGEQLSSGKYTTETIVSAINTDPFRLA
ncbi:Nif3-like dinuclear metal center hexameric protein [Paenibacillus pasadenensis]|uniref:Nif3-like dinuclear metal center hexameric protein n=1 Tax=Paenibacillus pasadenensis TaxID=217090 RepID=UPI002042278B|nr:Nif3-like dinuclear metal center hexameric protein [Paenibacillus pasadenensis]MCM3746348.1 Nif3-like dinuclear metal center hexameric protein [Paenibacillus pasadenensis]